MSFNAFFYCIFTGFKNLFHRKLFTFFSILTIAVSVFLFSVFFILTENVNAFAERVGETVGITVFFNEDASLDDINGLQNKLKLLPGVKKTEFTSADDAWEGFKNDYFEGNPELIEAFGEDNPLENSESLEVFLLSLDYKDQIIQFLNDFPCVRQVNFSGSVISGLILIKKVITIISAFLMGLLLLVSIFLISNTVAVTQEFRRKENYIMKLLGATGLMVRLPFITEGIMMGLLGALIPLVSVSLLYRRLLNTGILTSEEILLSADGIREIFTPLSLQELFPKLSLLSLILGAGIGFLTALFTSARIIKKEA